MTEELCRAKFEEWWWINYHNGNPPRFGWGMWREGSGYKTDEDQCQLDDMWEAYRAAWNTRAEMEKSDGSGEPKPASFRVITINENPRLSSGIYYNYVNVKDLPPKKDEPRVFLNSQKKFMGVGLHSSFPDAEWHRSLSEKSYD